jgi:hypothetical protein
MILSFLLTYYRRLIFRNRKLSLYTLITVITYLVVLCLFCFTKYIEEDSYYFHRLFLLSYLFHFFYNHLYYGLGWESSFSFFLIFHMRMRNIMILYLAVNITLAICSLIILKIMDSISLLTLDYSSFNLLIVFLLIPNLLFFLVFPTLSTYIDLFDNRRGLIVHKFYAFPILIITISIPVGVQYLWLNISYGPTIAIAFTLLLMLFVFWKFKNIQMFWENSLLRLKPE